MTAQDLAVRQFLLTNLIRSEDKSHLIWRIPLDYLTSNLDDMGDFPYKDPDEIRYNKPTLFVRGTRSSYIADEMLPIIGRFFPRFELADVEAGHWVISENPEGFKTGELGLCACNWRSVLTNSSCGRLATKSGSGVKKGQNITLSVDDSKPQQEWQNSIIADSDWITQ